MFVRIVVKVGDLDGPKAFLFNSSELFKEKVVLIGIESKGVLSLLFCFRNIKFIPQMYSRKLNRSGGNSIPIDNS